MDLKRLLNEGRLIHHKTSKEEIANLLKLVKRDIEDAKIKNISADRRFATAYNAVLQSATIILYTSGYKPKGIGHHSAVFEAVKDIIDKEQHKLIDYFDSCRAKRNITDYSCAGKISGTEAEELIKEAEKFLKLVLAWIKAHFPSMLN